MPHLFIVKPMKSIIKNAAIFILSLLIISVSHSLLAAPLSESEIEQINQWTTTSDIPQLQALMNSGQLSSVKLTQFYLKQIETKNQNLNAIISIIPNALANARMLDKERASGNLRSPLHGIPIVVKDNIETKKVATTAGSLALKDNFTNRDATLIKNLKRAGAIILAKSNLSEWANFRSERSSSGWSAIGGQTRNPLDLNRTACGSSAGSAAAVAGNLAVAAIGTETDGSITCPSSAVGIVGIKPSLGLVSRYRVVPLANSQDTAGPMAKSVGDAAIVLAAMQGKDNADPATKLRSFQFKDDYSKSGKAIDLTGLRIGLLESRVHPHEGAEAVYQQALGKIKKAGAVVVADLKTPFYEGYKKDRYAVLLYEFKHDINKYLKTLPNDSRKLSLEKLIQFNIDHADREMPFFKQEIFVKAQAKGPLTDQGYLDALERLQKATREEGLDRLVKQNNLDIIISPTLGAAWSIDQINGGKYSGGYSSYSAISGYPYLTLPMGKLHHLPLGLSVIGVAKEDAKVIAVGRALEKLFSNKTQ